MIFLLVAALLSSKNKVSAPGLPAADYFFVNVDYKKVKVLLRDITWTEGMGDYVAINLQSSKRPLVVRTSLKAIEAELPGSHIIRI